ncbi:methyl-accepting chemotaxis protein [Shewanella loihica]|uniref:Methyl-accepting chemotaxis sensory transducer n=1 Tax=Shewanella loihica (strain ATCC BAA-1088 / PV-4) TaxID=323850 RepID=A3QH20_SHELP|nr:methyl-accepting chemotaxis protein [Shewanella loihica]ABO24768.1 methyl-accepting chemotaxis sensory transducer [Shewanella loihica PV-4]
MREVNFRTIDKLFIKMSINDKFWVIGALFFIAITCIGVSRYQGSIDAIEQASMTALESELSGMVRALETSGQTDKFTSLNIQPSGQASSSRSQDSVTAVVRSAAGQNLSLTQNVASRERDAKQSALYSLLLTYLWLLPFAVLLYWNATFIGGALWVLWTTTKNIAKGDLTSRLGFHPGRDEFGTIGCALDNAMDTLTELVVTVKDNAETLHHTASSFASENQESERQIEQQYQSLDSVATAMEEMTASAGEVSNISNSSVEKVEQNSQSIRQSYERVQKAIKDIEQLSGFIEQTSDSVSTLKVNATKINEVITTINAISEQTNLLALNAAIEAARAGEMGRGFAVVADEVRTLASRTQSATVEIQAMIENLQQETNNIDNITQRTVKQAESSQSLITEIGTDVSAINESSQSVIDMSFQIAASSEEQSAVANDIASELSEIRQQANVIKELANQSSIGVSQLSQASESLGKILARYQTA